MQDKDLKLFQQIKADNPDAFDKLFHLYYEQLVQQAYIITQNQADAEDIVQSVFIKLWTKKKQITIQQSVRAYLHRMVHHQCIDYFRQLKSRAAIEIKHAENTLNLSAVSPEETLLKAETLLAIYSKIETLPSKCKIVFKLSRFEELSYEEIAVQLDISKKTVEYHVSTALKLLRKSVFGITLLFLIES